ncbi:hypothetical protein [Natrinema sp. 74]|uniref:hypothetical protein n=1 Tax=Natrinema sp. 74 TaxID=3384159 RepID=UPI0038D50021
MKRRSYLTGVGGVLSIGLADRPRFGSNATDSTDPQSEPDESATSRGSPATAALRNPSFEEYLTGWTVGTDLPAAADDPTVPVDHAVSVTSERASDGMNSLRLYIEGIADDGTIWVEQPVNFTGVQEVTVDVYSHQQSFNRMSQVAFFAGTKPRDGLSERDFNREHDIEDHSGWKTYTYSVSDLTGVATLAVGMNVVWETDIRRFFDNVRLVDERSTRDGS